MRILTLILIGALVMAIPSAAFALGLTVKASITSGTSLGPHILLKCPGYKATEVAANPFQPGLCQDQATATSLEFGTLITHLVDSTGAETSDGADCFYAKDFYIVYLYPDAWGGKGYELKQLVTTFPTAIQNSVTFTPVYSKDDKFKYPDGTYVAQGILNDPTLGITGEAVGIAKLAREGGLILKSKRGRIVRAEYGIPPKPTTGDIRPTGWQPIPLSTPGPASYSVSITITITEWL